MRRNSFNYRVKDAFLYAGIGEENFKKIYPHVRKEIRADNQRSLQKFSALAFVLFSLNLLVAIFADLGTSFCILYSIMMAISLICCICSYKLRYNTDFSNRLAVYSFAGSLLLFSIILGAVLTPNEISATFMVIMVAIPLIITDRPSFYIYVQISAYVIFIIALLKFGDSKIAMWNATNATIFSLFSLVASVLSMNVKLQKHFLEFANKIASKTDILTNLRNRKSYEEAIVKYKAERLPRTYVVYMDVNGLHAMNDENGHGEGDKMLITIANMAQQCFGRRTYRIGGDEYVVLDDEMTREQVEAAAKKMTDDVTAAGYSVSLGLAFYEDGKTLTKMIAEAEQNMYDAKAHYYQVSGKNRRRI